MQRSAGPAYGAISGEAFSPERSAMPPQAAINPTVNDLGTMAIPRENDVKTPPPKKGQVIGEYMYVGGDPSQQSNWKKVK